MDPVRDQLARPLRSLRLSVTDRCNLRCGYCMPEESYTWLPRKDLLTLEEHAELVQALVPLGVRRVRLTGGEPLLRRNLSELVAGLARISDLEDLCLTTNAVFLEEAAQALKVAGLGRITISLDTLRRERFQHLTRRDDFDSTMAGIEAAAAAGFTGTKLNAVILRGENDDEIGDLLRFGQEHGIEVRFIEYMDVGGATRWTMDKVVPIGEILRQAAQAFGDPEPLEPDRTTAPADRFVLPNGQVFGVIASTTRPFCAGCDRARITADGRFFSCLYAREGTPLLQVLREEGPEAAAARVAATWSARNDRGAEKRLLAEQRGALAGAEELRGQPHLEMHTRGG
ncbi:Cyclic pyranopterin monophosphate synthase [Planctomycetes bacterium Poly30]|uniref:GTP 3',8-cyclase n=1 Tax=Saltatorellus ferox TaxID=2528018 RepID=A0A518ETV3_9BACT|nr:Cyclic pyranopterin monophosphate synthase [Planctomycetes bacterium Poly30]